MSRMNLPIGPDELDTGSPEASAAETAGAMAVAAQLSRLAQSDCCGPSQGFEDRVWAALASEPVPAPATAANRAVRDRKLRGFLSALLDAPRVAFGASRPFGARRSAFALVLAAALILSALGGVAAAGAAALFGPSRPSPTSTTPPSTIPDAPSVGPSKQAPAAQPHPRATPLPKPTPKPLCAPGTTQVPEEGPGQSEEPELDCTLPKPPPPPPPPHSPDHPPPA